MEENKGTESTLLKHILLGIFYLAVLAIVDVLIFSLCTIGLNQASTIINTIAILGVVISVLVNIWIIFKIIKRCIR